MIEIRGWHGSLSKGKAEKMSDDDKVAKLFGEEAYGKAKFAKAAK